MKQQSLIQISELIEGHDLEFKKAAGRDGRGQLPDDFFETYSAMANSGGGCVILGVEESKDGKFQVSGIEDTAKVLKSLWDSLNNRQRVSLNVLNDQDVKVVSLEEKSVIAITIRHATRSQRPIFVGTNPFIGTYRRRNEGDYLCSTELVKRMLVEQTEPVADGRLLVNYGVDEIEKETLAVYRIQFKNTKPDHPWNDLDDLTFLKMLGAYAVNREDKTEGLTVAGLLMFGRLRSILDELPYYIVDYQEQLNGDERWSDRITTDGTWSGNLFDFYRAVIKKLTADLKIPFRLKGTQRIDDSSVHQALREALVNVLIHSDYAGHISVLVVKQAGLFKFRNPGAMRVAIEDAIRGGVSDCRNRNLQKMFQLVGLGEQAGSGLPKIYHSWKQQSWRTPELLEYYDPDRTELSLRTVSLLSEETIEQLKNRFGFRFENTSEIQRLALATALLEGHVTHARLKSMAIHHSRDISLELAALVRQGLLVSKGPRRSTSYSIPPTEELHIDSAHNNYIGSSEHLGSSSEHLGSSSEHLAELRTIAEQVNKRRKVPKSEMRNVILQLCKNNYLTLSELASLLNRSTNALRIHYLANMLSSQELILRFPESLNHPHQAYLTRSL